MVTGVPNKECWTTNCWGGEGELGCIEKGEALVSSGPHNCSCSDSAMLFYPQWLLSHLIDRCTKYLGS